MYRQMTGGGELRKGTERGVNARVLHWTHGKGKELRNDTM